MNTVCSHYILVGATQLQHRDTAKCRCAHKLVSRSAESVKPTEHVFPPPSPCVARPLSSSSRPPAS